MAKKKLTIGNFNLFLDSLKAYSKVGGQAGFYIVGEYKRKKQTGDKQHQQNGEYQFYDNSERSYSSVHGPVGDPGRRAEETAQ